MVPQSIQIDGHQDADKALVSSLTPAAPPQTTEVELG